MFKQTLIFTLLGFLIGCSAAPTVAAKPTAPVTINHTTPANAQPGDVISSTITVTAETKLKQISVTVAVHQGVELLSQHNSIDFVDLANGESRELEVRLRLLEPVGYLSVFATTLDNRNVQRTKSSALLFGQYSADMKKPTPATLQENGETLILLPAEERP